MLYVGNAVDVLLREEGRAVVHTSVARVESDRDALYLND